MLKNHRKGLGIKVSDPLHIKLLKKLENLKIKATHKNNTISFFKDGIRFVLMVWHYDEDLSRNVIANGGIACEVKSLQCLKAILCCR